MSESSTPPGGRALRVLIADDDPLVRAAIRALFADQPDLRVDGEAANGPQAVERAVARRPDVVLLDEDIAGLDTVAVIGRIRAAAPEVQVVVFSSIEDPDRGVAGLRSGATGFLPKEMSGEALLRALRGLAQGEAALSRALTLRVVEQLHRVGQAGEDPRPMWNRLTSGEWQVLYLLGHGSSVHDAADAIGIATDLVRERIEQILLKLEVATLDEALAEAASLDEVTRRRLDRRQPPGA